MSFAISKDPYQQNGTLGILAGCRNTAGRSLSTVQSSEKFWMKFTSSWLIPRPATTKFVPFGMKRPSEKEKSLIANRRVMTERKIRTWVNLDQVGTIVLTEARAVETMRLFHEAIKFPHLLHRYLVPPLCFYDHRNLLSQRLDIRSVCRQIIKYVRQDLEE